MNHSKIKTINKKLKNNQKYLKDYSQIKQLIKIIKYIQKDREQIKNKDKNRNNSYSQK